MGHFAQYRHRGGGSTGFVIAAPLGVQFSVAVSTTHVMVTTVINPGGGIVSAIAQTYLLSNPNVINEQFAWITPGNQTGTFVYSGGQQVGIRMAWSIDGVRPASPWSPQQTLTF